jgi:hypothetical protein
VIPGFPISVAAAPTPAPIAANDAASAHTVNNINTLDVILAEHLR